MVNQYFRRDVFVKGRNLMLPQERLQATQNLKLCLIVPKEEVKLEFTVGPGKLAAKEKIYGPVVEALAASPLTIAELNGLPGLKQTPIGSVMEMCLLFIHSGQFHLVSDGGKGEAHEPAERFNQVVLKRAIMGGAHNAMLASPIIGSGVGLNLVQMIATHVIMQQPTIQFDTLVNEVWKSMESQGRRFVKEGRTLESVEENMKELSDRMRNFADRRLPILKMLKVIS